MNHLLYASDEMFSSTQLVRKSKDIFDKLVSNKIEKAIILRDGKPNFMLLEFHKYEEIMKEYQKLKSENSNNQHKKIQREEIELKLDLNITDTKILTPNIEIIEKEELEFNPIIEEIVDNTKEDIDNNDNEELKKVLAQIEALDLGSDLKEEAKERVSKKSPAEIKEFWN